jgi:hypothetical protein
VAVLLTRRLLVTSEDNFPGSDASSGRWEIGSTSLFLHSLGIRPFIDVIWTREQEEGMKGYPRGRNNIMLQAAVATLSSGPVGIGDGPGGYEYLGDNADCGSGRHSARTVKTSYSYRRYVRARLAWRDIARATQRAVVRTLTARRWWPRTVLVHTACSGP